MGRVLSSLLPVTSCALVVKDHSLSLGRTGSARPLARGISLMAPLPSVSSYGWTTPTTLPPQLSAPMASTNLAYVLLGLLSTYGPRLWTLAVISSPTMVWLGVC